MGEEVREILRFLVAPPRVFAPCRLSATQPHLAQKFFQLSSYSQSFLYKDPFFQVSTKQCEIGIGQVPFTTHRHKLVVYLPYMYADQWLLRSRKPKPVASYDTIVNPFDYYTWGFTFLTIFIQFSLLLVAQNVWSKASGGHNPNDYIYEGRAKVPI